MFLCNVSTFDITLLTLLYRAGHMSSNFWGLKNVRLRLGRHDNVIPRLFTEFWYTELRQEAPFISFKELSVDCILILL